MCPARRSCSIDKREVSKLPSAEGFVRLELGAADGWRRSGTAGLAARAPPNTPYSVQEYRNSVVAEFAAIANVGKAEGRAAQELGAAHSQTHDNEPSSDIIQLRRQRSGGQPLGPKLTHHSHAHHLHQGKAAFPILLSLVSQRIGVGASTLQRRWLPSKCAPCTHRQAVV